MACEEVWQVHTELDDGTSYVNVVLAGTAMDACVLVGNMIRAARGVDVIEGTVGIREISARELDDDYKSMAVNAMFQRGS